MTATEVERLLGGPPGSYQTGPLYASGMVVGDSRITPDTELRKWSGNEGTIYLWFDRQDRVVVKAFHSGRL
jgi:hypothetical protein